MSTRAHRLVAQVEVLETRRMLFSTYAVIDGGEATLSPSYDGLGIVRTSNLFQLANGLTDSFTKQGLRIQGRSVAFARPPQGYFDALVRDVNDAGTMVGQADNTQAMAWTGGPAIDLGPGKATAISADGNYIVGLINTSSNNISSTHAFLYGKKKDLGTLGGRSSRANDVNNSKIIVGQATNGFGRSVPFYWNGSMHGIGDPSSNGEANAVNEAGIVVGQIAFDSFMFNVNTQMLTSLPDAAVSGAIGGGEALDINNANQVVGYTRRGTGASATIWEDGKAADLNTLIPSGLGFTLEYAKSINDKGQIIAVASKNGGGVARSFLLTPNRASLSSRGTLVINGSITSDVVNVAIKGSKVKLDINGAGQTFSKSAVKRLSITLAGGSDTLTLGAGLRAATISGGSGNDTFNIRNGVADVVDGGTGTDRGRFDSGDSRTSVETILG